MKIDYFGLLRFQNKEEMNYFRLFKLLLIALNLLGLYAQDPTINQEQVDTAPDTCRCYCCPSASNPNGINEKCDPKNPPLAGSIPIGGGAGASACNPQACNGYFAEQCPPFAKANSRGAAVRAGCRTCPDGILITIRLVPEMMTNPFYYACQGPFGNGTFPNKDGLNGGLNDQLNDYKNSGESLKSHSESLKARLHYFKKFLFQSQLFFVRVL